MPRHLWIVLPLEILLLALGSFACEVVAGFSPRPAALRPVLQLLLWAVEAAGLAGLFLIARGELENRRGDIALGVAVGAAAWIFRGPVVGTTLLAWGVASRYEVWASSLSALGSYLACGWILGFSARWIASATIEVPRSPTSGSLPLDLPDE